MNIHAWHQLQKRYGIQVAEETLLKKIRADEYVCRRHSSDPDTWIYDVHYKGDVLRLVVNGALTAIITILPQEFPAKKAKDSSRRARKNAPRVDECEEAYQLVAEAQEEDRAIGLELESYKDADKFWRASLIKALTRIEALEKQIEEQS